MLLQVADKLPNSPAVLVTAGDEGAAYCCRSTKGEHTGFVPVFKVGSHTLTILAGSLLLHLCDDDLFPLLISSTVQRRSASMFVSSMHVCSVQVHAGVTDVVVAAVQQPQVDVVDTTGAGDAFTAGFIYKVGCSQRLSTAVKQVHSTAVILQSSTAAVANAHC